MEGGMVRLRFDAVRRDLDDCLALALLDRLERRSSVAALDLAESLARAVASGASTHIVLDEDQQAELLEVLEEWRADGEIAAELRWIYMALRGSAFPGSLSSADGRRPERF